MLFIWHMTSEQLSRDERIRRAVEEGMRGSDLPTIILGRSGLNEVDRLRDGEAVMVSLAGEYYADDWDIIYRRSKLILQEIDEEGKVVSTLRQALHRLGITPSASMSGVRHIFDTSTALLWHRFSYLGELNEYNKRRAGNFSKFDLQTGGTLKRKRSPGYGLGVVIMHGGSFEK